ncbi:MAG: sigma-E processing peptidase SpoIIGA [Clostridia bacterium]|nr:sigma-E processing peptidase SpoIIGA [Clostridia bacterium]
MAGSPIIYIDVVFGVNFLMDFLILWSVARFGRFRTNWLRLLVAALLGSFYLLIILLFPKPGFLGTIGVKLLVSLIMILLAFPWHSLKLFFQALACFYFISFMVGGAMLGGICFLQGSIWPGEFLQGVFFFTSIPSAWLLAGLASLFLFGCLASSLIKKGLFRKLYLVSMVVCFGEKRIAARSLVDTGNQLRDPLTRCPVVIMEYSLLKDVLPSQLQALYEGREEPELDKTLQLLAGTSWAVKVRVIPFKTIGRRKGMLLGLKPDMLYVVTEEKTVKHHSVIVGVYAGTLSPEDEYRALLHPELLQIA